MIFLDGECLGERHVVGEGTRTSQIVAFACPVISGEKARNREFRGVEIVRKIPVQRIRVTLKTESDVEVGGAQEELAQLADVGCRTSLLDAA